MVICIVFSVNVDEVDTVQMSPKLEQRSGVPAATTEPPLASPVRVLFTNVRTKWSDDVSVVVFFSHGYLDLRRCIRTKSIFHRIEQDVRLRKLVKGLAATWALVAGLQPPADALVAENVSSMETERYLATCSIVRVLVVSADPAPELLIVVEDFM